MGGYIRGCAVLALGVMLAMSQAAPVAAQEVDGEWDVRWAQAIRNNSDGSVEIQKWGDAVLVLSVQDGQVTGRWTTNVLEEVNWVVEGTFDGERLRLVGAEHDSDNAELSIVDRIEFVARLDGDSLEGTVAMSIRGRARSPSRRPFTAERRNGG